MWLFNTSSVEVGFLSLWWIIEKWNEVSEAEMLLWENVICWSKSGWVIWVLQMFSKYCEILNFHMGATKQGIDLIGSENEFTVSADMNLSKFGEIVKDRGAWWDTVNEVAKSRIQLSEWRTKATAKKNELKRELPGDFPGGPVAKTQHSQCRGPGLIPSQGTRSHMPQLRVCVLQLKILCAAPKTWCSQINNFFFFLRGSFQSLDL